MHTIYIYCKSKYNFATIPSCYPDPLPISIYQFSTHKLEKTISRYFEQSKHHYRGQQFLEVLCIAKNRYGFGTTYPHNRLFYYPDLFTYTIYKSLDACLENNFEELL